MLLISVHQEKTQATGVAGVIADKGGIGLSFKFNETSLCFVPISLSIFDFHLHFLI